MPKDETTVRDHRFQADTARTSEFNPRFVTAGMAVVLELLVHLPEGPDPTPTTLAFSTARSSIPVFEVVTVLTWIAALVVIRRVTASSEVM